MGKGKSLQAGQSQRGNRARKDPAKERFMSHAKIGRKARKWRLTVRKMRQ